MTTKEAIAILEKQFDKSCNSECQNAAKLDFEDALHMAITALRTQSDNGVDSKITEPEFSNEKDGLKAKYHVFKANTGEIVNNCFVLRPDKDPAAIAAIQVYASTTSNKDLASDLIQWVGAEQPLTLDELRKMDGETVWIERIGGRTPYDCGFAFVHRQDNLCRTVDGCNAFFELYGIAWLAYRHSPKEDAT